MTLLLDQNLSPSLVIRLGDVFPGTVHVRDVGLSRASDEEVWAWAAANGCCIVSKDADFHQLAFLRGPPPMVVWVQRGNASTADVEQVIRARQADVIVFLADRDAAFLAIR